MKPVVYIIDDNMVSEFATKMALQQSNVVCEVYSFETAASGLIAFGEALNNMQKIPDVILLDLNMPNIDGWEFLDRIGIMDYPIGHVAIYILSTFTNANARSRAREHPLVKGYFERPISKGNIEDVFTERV